MEGNTKTRYKVTFKDIFDKSTICKNVELTQTEYLKALECMECRRVVVNQVVNAIHMQLIIIDIKL